MSAYVPLVPSTPYPRIHVVTFFNLLAILGGDIVLGSLRLDDGSVRFNLIEGMGESIRHIR